MKYTPDIPETRTQKMLRMLNALENNPKKHITNDFLEEYISFDDLLEEDQKIFRSAFNKILERCIRGFEISLKEQITSIPRMQSPYHQANLKKLA